MYSGPKDDCIVQAAGNLAKAVEQYKEDQYEQNELAVVRALILVLIRCGHNLVSTVDVANIIERLMNIDRVRSMSRNKLILIVVNIGSSLYGILFVSLLPWQVELLALAAQWALVGIIWILLSVLQAHVARSYIPYLRHSPHVRKIVKSPWLYHKWKKLPDEVVTLVVKLEDHVSLLHLVVEETTLTPDKPAVVSLWGEIPDMGYEQVLAIWLDNPSGTEEKQKVLRPATSLG